MMSEQANGDRTEVTLTPRQDRAEAALYSLLCSGATRSDLREAACLLADALQAQHVPHSEAIARVRSLVQRATPAMHAHGMRGEGDAPADRSAMIERWVLAQYQRAD